MELAWSLDWIGYKLEWKQTGLEIAWRLDWIGYKLDWKQTGLESTLDWIMDYTGRGSSNLTTGKQHDDTVNQEEPIEISSLYLCGACHHPVTWEDKGILCEDCLTWFHISCQNINSNEYSRLDNSSVAWACLNWNSINYSRIASNCSVTNINKCSTTNEDLSSDSQTSIDSLDDNAMPKHESSPKSK